MAAFCSPHVCLMDFQIECFHSFAFADSENATLYGECEALELGGPGFLSQRHLCFLHGRGETMTASTHRVVRFAV